MTVLRLAFRNVLGAGLKTWLNVAVLSLAFVVIVWVQGFYDGVNQQALDAIIDIEYAGGQFWHEEY
ncbi:MAG: ABC transporter permease, partial [Calditrichaeota bacterium]|nr:ABC transporter permease [Calditrichota bacterium]